MSTVVNLTRNWTDLYTWRLPEVLREGRRAEIESDLWEHQRQADLQGADATDTATEILLRFVFGIPSDCVWRFETGVALRAEKRTDVMNIATGRSKVLIALTGVAFLMIVITGISITSHGWDDSANLGWMLTGIIPTAIGAPSILAGFWLVTKRPGLSILLVTVGCLVTALVWFWMFMITVPISAGLIGVTWYQAKKSGWRSGEVQLA